MTNRRSMRRYRKRSGRRIWVFSEHNCYVRQEHNATSACPEQVRMEAAAQASHMSPDHKEDDHA